MKDPREITTQLVKDFTKRIKNCSFDDYCATVLGILIYAELIKIHMDGVYEKEGESADAVLKEYVLAAKEIAQEIDKRSKAKEAELGKKLGKKLNKDLN